RRLDVLPQFTPLLHPRRRRVLVEYRDERAFAHRLESRHHLVARLDSSLSGERLPEVEEQRHLAEQPTLRGDGGYVVRRHTFTDLGHLGGPETTRHQLAFGGAAREERVAAEGDD